MPSLVATTSALALTTCVHALRSHQLLPMYVPRSVHSYQPRKVLVIKKCHNFVSFYVRRKLFISKWDRIEFPVHSKHQETVSSSRDVRG